jgi:glycosyltransferase involved in cell wall biosynthesis
MRIGITSTTIEPALTSGQIDGIGTYTKNLYEELSLAGHTVVPHTFRHPYLNGASYYPNGRLLRASYMRSTITSIVNPLLRTQHGKIKNHIDIFHSTDHMIPKIKDVPLVATINDGLMFKYPTQHHIKFERLKTFARNRTLHWPDHFITISNAMVAELVEQCRIPEKKISVVYLGISPWWHETVSEESKSIILKKLGLPPKFLLFTGTLQFKKNLPRLVNAYLKLPADIQQEYPLVVTGRASGPGMEDSLAAVKLLTEKKAGYWLKYVTLEELRTLFQCASAYLHPSLHEGFGLTLLEAFSSKTPVITSNITALPEIAGDAAYLVNPYSTTEITQAIKTLMTSTTMQTQLIEKGIARAQEFSWQKCAANTLEVYQSMLNKL